METPPTFIPPPRKLGWGGGGRLGLYMALEPASSNEGLPFCEYRHSYPRKAVRHRLSLAAGSNAKMAWLAHAVYNLRSSAIDVRALWSIGSASSIGATNQQVPSTIRLESTGGAFRPVACRQIAA
jgi:hypothetical protein